MPILGKCWFHLILNTYGSWLPGDPRGFRSRVHKLHSSGDYKNPPPGGEHEGLHAYSKKISGPPVTIKPPLRPVVGQAILGKIKTQEHLVLAVGVGSNHAHVLAELPDSRPRVKSIVGMWKQAASHRVRAELPGTIWAESGDPIQIRDQAHQQRVYGYILNHRDEGAWVWSFRDEQG